MENETITVSITPISLRGNGMTHQFFLQCILIEPTGLIFSADDYDTLQDVNVTWTGVTRRASA